MNIGITGATGFVGTHVAALARARGHRVTGFSRSAKADPRFDEMRGYAADAALDFSGCDALIHLAGESVKGIWTREKRARIMTSRVEGTRRVVGALAQNGPRPRVLVSASAIGFYGETGENAVDENSTGGSGFLADVSRAWEAEAVKAEAHGVRVVIPRISIVLGRSGGALEAMLPAFRAGLGGRLGSGRQWMSWIHLDDLAALLLEAATGEILRGVFNACSPNPVRNSEFAATLARALHRPAILPVPAFLLRAALGEFSQELLGSKRVLPRRALESGFRFQFPTLDAALTEILQG
jgi:uncharacterized protein (TIGR01777 family)